MNKLDYPRLTELKTICDNLDNAEGYFNDIEEYLNSSVASKKYSILEKEIQELDKEAWVDLKYKAANYLAKTTNRGWQQLFEALNEAQGYIYLASVGCSVIAFIPEVDNKTPDLEAIDGRDKYLLEVKTINISDDEAEIRQEKMHVHEVQYELHDIFLRKIDNVIEQASTQLQNYKPNEKFKRVVLLVVNLDESNISAAPILTQKIKKHVQQQNYSCDATIVKNAS